jgi:hypothetical protein
MTRMRKMFSYIVLGLSLIVFLIVYIKTQSFKVALIISGIGLAWFLVENIFELIKIFSKKSESQLTGLQSKKDKEKLMKKTENNPTLR